MRRVGDTLPPNKDALRDTLRRTDTFGKPNGWSLRLAGGYEAAAGDLIGGSTTTSTSGPGVAAPIYSIYRRPAWAIFSTELALRARFLSTGVGFDVGVGSGSYKLLENSNVESQGRNIYESNGAMSLFGPKVFLGPKVPLGRVSWTIGEVVGGIRFFTIAVGRGDISASNMFSLLIGGRTGIDVAISCDLHIGGQGGFNFQADPYGGGTTTKPTVQVVSAYGQAALTFQPSSECRREREAGEPSISVRQAAGAR
jgi:hypothetical protein